MMKAGTRGRRIGLWVEGILVMIASLRKSGLRRVAYYGCLPGLQNKAYSVLSIKSENKRKHAIHVDGQRTVLSIPAE